MLLLLSLLACSAVSVQQKDGDDDTGEVDTTDGYIDADGDGFESIYTGGNDCNDDDADIRPDAIDTAGDGIDQDCDGEDGEGG